MEPERKRGDEHEREQERVDVRGEVCPRPALGVRRRLSELEPGDELLVRGDYPPAKRNLERTCTKHGFEVREAGTGPDDESDTGDFQLRITVTEDAARSA